VATIIAPPEFDEQLYNADYEWKIMGRFVLTDRFTGGDPTPLDMRGRSIDSYERMLRGNKHLVGRTRIRAPRIPYDGSKEVKRVFDLDFTFKRAGEYFITFRMKKPKVSSNELRIVVSGDTTYDPFRQR